MNLSVKKKYNISDFKSSKVLENDNKTIIELALLAGTILTESGAETYRVEDTVERIMSLSAHQDFQCISYLTSLMITLIDSEGNNFTAVRRIKKHTINLYNIRQVNEISRELVSHRLSFKEAEEILNHLDDLKNDFSMNIIFRMLMSMGFTMMVGGKFFEILISGLAATSMVPIIRLLPKKAIRGDFIPQFVQSFVASLILAFFTRIIPSINMDAMIMGTLISLFPGNTLTNGIRDTLKGDYLTGAGNLLSALASALAMAFGTGMALLFMGGVYL